MATILATGTFDDWYRSQTSDDQKVRILRAVALLRQFGNDLKRPHADTIRGSSLKELIVSGRVDVIRIVYGLDREGNVVLLLGGDKKGVSEGSQNAWLDNLVRVATNLFVAHLRDPRHAHAWNPSPPSTPAAEPQRKKKHKPKKKSGPARFDMSAAAHDRYDRSLERQIASRLQQQIVQPSTRSALSPSNFQALRSAGFPEWQLTELSAPGEVLDPKHPQHQQRVDDMLARARKR